MTCSFRPEPTAGKREFRALSALRAEPVVEAPDLDALERAAFERGREAALAELPVADAERLRTAAQAIETAAEAFGAEVETFRELARAHLVELSLAIAERIVEREVSVDPRSLDALVNQALEAMIEPMRPVVRLSPADHGTWLAGSAGELDESARRIGAELAPDPELAPGEVVIHDGARTIDLRLPAVLAALRDALLDGGTQ